MEDQSQAFFTELLKIEADLPAFVNSLQEIKEAYTEWADGLGAEVEHVLSVGPMAGLQAALNALREQVQLFNVEALNAAQNTLSAVESIREGMETRAEQREEAASQRRRQRAAEDAQAVADAESSVVVDRSSKKAGSLEEEGADRQRGRLTEELALAEQLYQEELKRADLEEKSAVSRLDTLNRGTQSSEQEYQDTQRLGQLEEGLAEKRRAQILGEDTERQQASAKRVQEEEQLAAKQAAERQKLSGFEEDLAAKRRASMLKEDQQRQEAAAARLLDEDKLAATRLSNEEKLIEKQVSDVFSLAERQRVSDEERAARQRRLAEEIELEQQGLIDAHSAKPSFFEEALGDLGQMALKTAEVYAIWQAINAVVQLVGATLSAPVKIYEGGSKYLDDIQQSADRLTGTLAANVKYADGFSENFAKASQVAKDATIALRDIAAETGMSYEHLVTTFQSLVTAGVAYHVNNTREIVTLSQILDITNEQVKGQANLRGLLTDIPKLLNGTLQQGSAFLEVTKLTVDRAKELVANAKEHHDLLQQLEPLFAPYMTAAQQAAFHHQNIVKSLDEQKSRFEAILANPAYEHITELLKKILDFIDQNRGMLEELAGALGKVGLDVIKLGEHMLGIDSSARGLLSTFSALVLTTAKWAEYLSLVAKINLDIARLAQEVRHPGLAQVDDPRKLYGDILEQVKELKNVQNKFGSFQQQIEKIINAERVPSNFVGPLGENQLRNKPLLGSLDDDIDGLGNHPSVDHAPKERPDIKGEYEKQLALIKDYYDRYRDAVKDGEAELAVSKREAAQEISALNNREIAEIVTAGTKYRDELKKFYDDQIGKGKSTTKDRDNALAAFDSTQIKAVSARFKDTDAAVLAGRREGTRVLEIDSKNRLDLLKQEAQEELAIESDKYAQGYQTQLQYLENKELIEGRAYAAELEALNKEIEAAGLGTERRSQLQAQALVLDQRYTGQVDRNAIARIAALERENQAVRVHAINMDNAARELQITSNEIEDTLRQPAGLDLRSFGIKDQELAAKQREIDIEMSLARAKLETAQATDKQTDATKAQIAASTDLIRKLEEERAALNNDRLKNLQGQLQSIQSSNVPNGLKDLYNRAAIQTTSDDVIRNTDLSKLSPAELDQFNETLRVLRDSLADATPSISRSLDQLEKKLFGFDLGQALSKATTSAEKFGVGLEAVSNAMANVGNIINSIQKASLQGGVAGGIGEGLKEGSGLLSGLLSSGLLKGVSKSIPFIGEALGGVLEILGGLFTHTAAKIADDVKKSMQDTVTAFQNGDATLQQTIINLQNQRISAISQLSGAKGGQDQLDKLLPQLDQQIQQFQQQQKTTIQNFEEQLTILERHSDTLGTIQQQWDGIVKSVRDYVSAGGDATLASRYLSAELEKIQSDAQDQLDQGDQQAIQDAISLNGLLQQRADLVKSFQKQEFDLLNADSLERRQTGAVSRGAQITEAKQQYQQQLDSLDQQITLTQAKVDKESQVFSIASDINDLHRQDDALTLKALDQQISKWLDLKSIIDSIRIQDSGVYTSNNPAFTSNPSVVVNISGDIIGVNPLDVGKQVGDSVQQAVQNAIRNGQIP